MTSAERYGMGWTNVASVGGGGIGGPGGYINGQTGRRCCPVCKAECTVRTVVPIYVRESDTAAATEASSTGTASAAAAAAAQGIEDGGADIGHTDTGGEYDATATTGLRRRRGGGGTGGGGTGGAGAAPLHDSSNDDNDNASLSTISTEGDADDDNNNRHRAFSDTTVRTSPARQSSSGGGSAGNNGDIPSRPTPQPYLHQRSSMEESMQASEPMTPLINNHRHHSPRRAAGPPPPSPPRAARPSSLSNGLSLSFWSSVVDTILGNSPHGVTGTRGGGADGGGNGYVPPIHRPGSWRGRHRASNGAGGGSSAGNHEGRDVAAQGLNGNGGADGQSASEDASAGMGSSAIAVPHFPPAPVEDATTEFLSRLLLLLGSFVIFCLLLF